MELRVSGIGHRKHHERILERVGHLGGGVAPVPPVARQHLVDPDDGPRWKSSMSNSQSLETRTRRSKRRSPTAAERTIIVDGSIR